MRRPPHTCRAASAAAVAAVALFATCSASAEFAGSIPVFNQGTVTFANPASQYSTSSAALGQPNRIAGAGIGFPGPVTPFNPPFEENEIVAVGLGGNITLELTSPVVGSSGTLQIGVFTAAGLNDPTFTGQAENPARTFAGKEYGADRTAVVEVASVLGDFRSLGRVLFTAPTQGFANQSDPYAFPDPAIPSNFDQPFTGSLSSFNGLNSGQITAMYNGSAGGTWLTVPQSIASEIGEIRYVRISDPLWQVHADDSLVTHRISADDPLGNGQPFNKPADVFIDGVNVIPEPAGIALMLLFAVGTAPRLRRA